MTTATANECLVDRRCPERESRRKNDCFPHQGAMVIALGFCSLVSFIGGVIVGALAMVK